jgi:hypothetical protein
MMKNKQGRWKGTVWQGNKTAKSFPHSSLRSDRGFPVPPLCRRIAHRPLAWPQAGEAGFAAGLRQHCTDIIRFSHGASSGRKIYRSSFIPGLHDVCMVFEKAQ